MRDLSIIAVISAISATGCSTATLAEAEESAALVVDLDRGEAMTGQLVELSTNFPFGVDDITSAEAMADFIAAEIPCAVVEFEGSVVWVDFGPSDVGCAYSGRVWSGMLEADLLYVIGHDLKVSQTWTRLSDGKIALDGRASIQVDGGKTRVVYDATWSTPDALVEVEGERTQNLIDPEIGLASGVWADGERTWLVDGHFWTMGLSGIETLVRDPVPQAGRYDISHPDGGALALTFERIDKEAIRMSVVGARKEMAYEINADGEMLAP